MDTLFGMIPSVLMIVSPILITAAGGMICERSGVVNIALEGLMGIGAFSRFNLDRIAHRSSVWNSFFSDPCFCIYFTECGSNCVRHRN